MEQKIDRRTRRTRSAIRASFAKLLAEKDITKITIRDIADSADINRATFYLHYSDIYQVLEDVENEIANAFFKILDKFNIKEILFAPYPLLKAIGDQLDARPEYSKFVFQADSHSSYFAKIKSELRKRMKMSFESTIADELYCSLTFVANGTLDAYEEWYETGKKVPLEQFCGWLSMVISNGISAILK